jgi:hypothetical protein
MRERPEGQRPLKRQVAGEFSMSIRKTCAIFACVSLFAVGAAIAGRVASVAPSASDGVRSAAASIDRGSGEAPIVSGRSISIHHKTKMHHVKAKPVDTIEESPMITEMSTPND